MRPPTDTDGQRRAPARPAVVRLAALAVIGLGTIWVPAAASAAAPESRGPTGPARRTAPRRAVGANTVPRAPRPAAGPVRPGPTRPRGAAAGPRRPANGG